MVISLLKLLIFPGLAFVLSYGLLLEFVDRKVYARLQNRIGPPWYQPLADLLKLLGKETVLPGGVNRGRFRALPLVSLTSAVAAFLYVPVVGGRAAWAFEGDLIIVLYLSMLPALMLFLAGWYSRSVYATMGATRTLTQLFSYEVPLFIAMLTPALIAGDWSISGISAFFAQHPLLALLNIPSFVITILAVQGKLERVPFDQAEAETEIVSGPLVEYSGRLLAVFRMSASSESVLMTSAMAAIYLPFYTGLWWVDLPLYFVKTLLLLLLATLIRAAAARLRIEQMAAFFWRFVTPAALLWMLAVVFIRGGLA